MDGDTMDMEINSDKYELSYSLKPEKYVHINTSKSVCSDVSFYQCFADKVSADNFENCPIKCSPLSLPFKNTSIIPACEKDEEAICAAKNVIYPIFLRIIDNELCPKSCTILQYSGKLMLKHVRQEINGNAYITIWYKFKLPEYVLVSEEYLIYDTTSMIGAVGGTLGIFIGFSCSSLLTFITDLFKKQETTINNQGPRSKDQGPRSKIPKIPPPAPSCIFSLQLGSG